MQKISMTCLGTSFLVLLASCATTCTGRAPEVAVRPPTDPATDAQQARQIWLRDASLAFAAALQSGTIHTQEALLHPTDAVIIDIQHDVEPPFDIERRVVHGAYMLSQWVHLTVSEWICRQQTNREDCYWDGLTVLDEIYCEADCCTFGNENYVTPHRSVRVQRLCFDDRQVLSQIVVLAGM